MMMTIQDTSPPLNLVQALTGIPLSVVAHPCSKLCILEQLVDDILIAIFGTLPIRDILNVRLTCKRLETITRLNAVWHAIFHREVVERGRPLPGDPYLLIRQRNPVFACGDDELDSLSDMTSEIGSMEHHTHLALRLEKRWSKSRPAVSNSFQFSLREISVGKGEVKDAFLLFGGTHLVVVHDHALSLWNLVPPSTQQTPRTPYANLVGNWAIPSSSSIIKLDANVNAQSSAGIPRAEAHIAVSTTEGNNNSSTILRVSPYTSSIGSVPFEEVSLPRFDGVLVHIHGHILAYEKSDASGYLGIELTDWTAPEQKSVRALLFEPNTELGAFLDMCIYTPSNSGDLAMTQFVVVIWEFHIGVYPLPEVLRRPWSESPVNECGEDENLCGRAVLVTPFCIFALNEQVSKPVSFTSCTTGRNTRSTCGRCRGYCKILEHEDTKLKPLTILAHHVQSDAGLVQAILQPVLISVGRSTSSYTSTLRSTSLFAETEPHREERQIHFRFMRSSPPRSEGPCVALSLGASGRGVRAELINLSNSATSNVQGSTPADLHSSGVTIVSTSESAAETRPKQALVLYRCIPTPVLSPCGVLDSTIDFYPNQPIHSISMVEFEERYYGVASRARGVANGIGSATGEIEVVGEETEIQNLNSSAGASSIANEAVQALENRVIMTFDEGVGRLVVAKRGSGAVSVMDFC